MKQIPGLISRFVSVIWQEHAFLELSEQLSVLLEAGLPLLEGIEHLLHDRQRRFTSRILKETALVVQSGEPLSAAWQSYVSPLFKSLIQSGEQSGQLADVLKNHVLHARARRKWIAQVVRVLAYPFMLLVITVALLFYIAGFVLPMFQNMYSQLGYQLSSGTVLVTRILYMTPKLLLYALLVVLVLLVCFHKVVVRNGNTFSRMPFLKLLQLSRTRMVASLLCMLLGAGLPLVQALQILHETKSPRWLSKTASTAMEQVLSGVPVSGAFPVGFDHILPLMLHTAEKTGDLTAAFERTEIYAQTMLYKKMDRLVRFLEPSLLMIMGGIVGLTMYAVFIPMYDFINVVSSTSH
jgi:general secretion pathway protein F